MIETFELDTGCAENRMARVRVLSQNRNGIQQLWSWLAARGTGPLGLDSETNAIDPRDRGYQLRFVQIADEFEVWLLDVETLGTAFIREVIRSHPYWVGHFVGSAEIPFIECAAPGAVRLESDDVPHMADTQVPLAYYDPRTVMPEDEKEGIDPRLAHKKGLKDTTTRELSPVLAATEKEMYEWFRTHAPKGQRTPERSRNWGFANVPTTEDVYRRYSALDPLMTIRLWHKMVAVLQARGQWDIVSRDLLWQWDIDRACFRGIMVDEPYARWLDQTMERVIKSGQDQLSVYGIPPSGTGGTVHAAFTQLGQAPIKHTKRTAKGGGGGPSWDKDVLKQLAKEKRGTAVGALAAVLTLSRQAGKFRKAYVEPMLTALDRDGLVHWSHRAIGTTTGRNSAMNPPLQQQPKKDTRVRAAYRAPDGYVLVTCDLAQGEPRTMAAASGDRNLQADIYSGDLNGAIAATAFGDAYVPAQGQEAGTASYLMRQGGKAGFLAKCYGGGDGRVLDTIGSQDRAVLRRWETRYQTLFAHSRQLNGQPAVVLESGRVCPLWDRYVVIDGDRPKLYPKASRKGLNYEAQGTQRDLLLACWERLRARGYAQYGWFWLHDEIILCVPIWLAEQAKRDLEECMTFVWREMRFECEANIAGRTWLPQPTEFDTRELASVD